MENNQTIHWVCSADSCSELESYRLNNSFRDTTLTNIKTSIIQKTNYPPLSEFGILQSSFLGTQIENEYDDYYCSPTISSILTMMIALEQKKIDIIGERTNIILVNNLIEDNVLKTKISEDNLKLTIHYLRKWLNNNYFQYFASSDYKLIKIKEELIYLINNYIYINKYNPNHKKLYDNIINGENINLSWEISTLLIKDKRQILTLVSNIKNLTKEHSFLLGKRYSLLEKIIYQITILIEKLNNQDKNINDPEHQDQYEFNDNIELILPVNIPKLTRIQIIEKLNVLYEKLLYYLNTNRFNFIKFTLNNYITIEKQKTIELASSLIPSSIISILPSAIQSRLPQDIIFTKFINYIVKVRTTARNVLCIVDKTLLSNFFNLPSLDSTQILIQNINIRNLKSAIKKQNQIFINRQLLLDNKINGIDESFCGNPNNIDDIHMFGIINSLINDGRTNTLTNDNVNMQFKLTEEGEYFKQMPPIEQIQIERQPIEEEDNDSNDYGNIHIEYFQKYLKYKQKYLELRKNKTI